MTTDFIPERRKLEGIAYHSAPIGSVPIALIKPAVAAALAEIDRLQAALDGAVEALTKIRDSGHLGTSSYGRIVAADALSHLTPSKDETCG